MSTAYTLSGHKTIRCKVSIPANTGNGSTLLALLDAAGVPGVNVSSFKILATLVDGTTARSAFVVASPRPGATITGTDYSNHGQPVYEGLEYRSEPSARDAESYFRSSSSSAIDAVVVAVLGS